MKEKIKQSIEQTQKKIEQNKEWQKPYNEQVEIMLESRDLISQFCKTCKNYEHLQFYLAEVTSNLFKIEVRYIGQPTASITLSKDGATKISTEEYNETNKKIFNCSIQLKDEDWGSKITTEFIEYFKKDVPVKAKVNELAKVESMLLAEFSKTSAVGKLLLGVQPIKVGNLYYPIPVIPDIAKTVKIKILTRTKVRKITIIDVAEEGQTLEQILEQVTSKAAFLLNLLATEQGDKWYKLMGFHGRKSNYPTIKVCIAVSKILETKIKEFEPFELKNTNGAIEYHYMTYDTDGAKITKIDTTLNN